ncbi:MAG: class I tRNA ligase family protein, partial [Christensenellaceae bacterium]
IEVVAGGKVDEAAFTDIATGKMVNSGFLDGLTVAEAKKRITGFLEEKGLGKRTVNYKLRDWVFSRQRYWGEPIPLVKCPCCGWVPLPEDQLPLTLPEVAEFRPGDEGESPLAAVSDWVNTTCPKCGGPAQRETDTMPQWAGSSWYFMRYCDPHNPHALASKEALDYWMPVDWYNGGMEHTTLHLLYSRFWHLFLHDIGVVSAPEPYKKRTSHGMILGANGEKMSKSRGNVVNPDDMVNQYGADAFRTYEMFMGAFDQPIPWSTQGVAGCRRFLDRVWRLQQMLLPEAGYRPAMVGRMHRAIRKVSEDFEAMKFNTAIAAMMELVNAFYSENAVTRDEYKTLLTLLSPVAPHICEEIWERLGGEGMICQQSWPAYDPALCVEDEVEIPVQVNGKVRARMTVSRSAAQDEIRDKALAEPRVAESMAGKTMVKCIVVPGKIVNIVVK